tara:strand:+ start:6254 stop:6682 length:429 start_codon:yes stop_codon:yes gene_type:complete
MSKTTTYLRDKWKDSLLTGQAFSVPALYVGIFNTMPTTEAGDDGVEPAIDPATGYARVLTTNKWQSGTGAGLAFENDEIFNFETLNVTWDGTTNPYAIVGIGLWDAPSGGNCLAYAEINPTRTIGVSQEMDIAAGGLTLTLE